MLLWLVEAVEAEVVYFKPAVVTGGVKGAVFLFVTCADTDLEVFPIFDAYCHCHLFQLEVVGITSCVARESVILSGCQQIGVVALKSEVLHLIVSKQTQVPFLFSSTQSRQRTR